MDQLSDEFRFRRHAANFARFLNGIVEVQSEDGIMELADAMGARHAKIPFNDENHFDPENWELFVIAAANHVAAVQPNDVQQSRALKAWQMLLKVVINRMKEAYAEEQRIMRSKLEQGNP